MGFPSSAADLKRAQEHLRTLSPPAFEPPRRALRVAGVFVCFERGGTGPGAAGDVGWAASAVLEAGRCIEAVTVRGRAGGPYQAGLLALREGPLVGAAVGQLEEPFDVLLVNATGRDHPRRAGLALHVGVLLDVPTVGVTHRPLLARGGWPTEPGRGSRAPLTVEGDLVGCWVRTRAGCRPLAVHAGWRTDLDTSCRIAVEEARHARAPEPLRIARRLAREARAADM